MALKEGGLSGVESCPGSAGSEQRVNQGKHGGLFELKELELEEKEDRAGVKIPVTPDGGAETPSVMPGLLPSLELSEQV